MNRKLHNTFLGLTASTAIFSLALVLGAPIAQPPSAQDALATAIEAEVRIALAQAGVQADEAEHARVAARAARAAAAALLDTHGGHAGGEAGDHHRNRHALAMPYFSFAPRG